MQKGYEAAASWYDAAKQLVFGDATERAEAHYLSRIPDGARVLIAGGGTGAMLENSALHQRRELQITFVDISPKMVAHARRRQFGSNTVHFEIADVRTFEAPYPYDIIITSFLLDNFTEATLRQLLPRFSNLLSDHGIWIDTDFCKPDHFRQRLVLQMMYLMFRAICGIEARNLPNVDNLSQICGFELQESAFFANKFIKTSIYVDKKQDKLI